MIKPFTHEELETAFDLVKDKEHWKNPIYSYCTSEEIKIIAAAIQYFTATEAKFDYIGKIKVPIPNANRFKIGDHIFKVRAGGYRAGLAGDH